MYYIKEQESESTSGLRMLRVITWQNGVALRRRASEFVSRSMLWITSA
jgi:hypothetical protein